MGVTILVFFVPLYLCCMGQAMQSIVLLSSVRRSLFSKETDRGAYLQQLMNFIREILQTNQGLHHQDNYHQFCRQLGRLKANYQAWSLFVDRDYSGIERARMEGDENMYGQIRTYLPLVK